MHPFSRRVCGVLLLACTMAASAAAAQETAPAAPADSARVYELSEVERQPRPLNGAELRAALEARYPPAHHRAGRGGTVFVSLVVGEDGAVGRAEVLSSTDSAFDAPTLASLALLRFEPATVGGTPVATRVEIPVQWQAPPPPKVDHAGEGVVTDARVEGGERVYTMSEVVAQVPTYELAVVEEVPRPRNLAEFRRALQRQYPPELRAARIPGLVTVRFRVTAQGTTEGFILRGSTDPRFDQPTVEALRTLRFSPARINGGPVAVWVELPVQWSVD